MRISTLFRAASFAAALALALVAAPFAAKAQTVTQQPQFAAPRTVLDVGNGDTEFRMITGSMAIFTSQGSGTGSTSGSATALTLTAVPTTAPCVGCKISGTGITSGTTVASYNGVTTIGLSAAMTVASGTAVAWGAACPTVAPTAAVAFIQAAVGADLPFYTQARICAWGGTGPGGQFVTFPIGAH
jgi:hypothetical protein